MKPLVSIIIVSYNVKQYLLKCLQTIFEVNRYDNFEVIVVDNNSSDGSQEAIENIDNVKLKFNRENVGFAEANNQGVDMAAGKLIFLLNPDTELTQNTLDLLVDIFQSKEETVIAGPKLLNTDGSVQESFWRFTNLLQAFLGAFSISLNNFYQVNHAIEVEALSGAALLLRKEDFLVVGGMDKNLFWYEDEDLCFRLRKYSGRVALYIPQAAVYHHISRSARRDYRIPIANQLISRIKFYKKHYSFFKYLVIIFITFIHIVVHGLLFVFLSFFSSLARKKMKAYLFTLQKLFGYLLGKERGIILP